jgi:hypothetical protein
MKRREFIALVGSMAAAVPFTATTFARSDLPAFGITF